MKWYKKILFMSFVSSLSAGAMACTSSDSIKSVPSSVFNQAISHPGTQIVDVRDAEEFAAGHIDGAVNIDVNSADFVNKSNAVLKKSEPVYVYCRSGKRSLKAAELLSKEGYRIVNLDNGIIGWEKDGFPVVR